MDFNDLLLRNKIDPATVLVLRHRPMEPELAQVLRWLASERPEWFNAYQQTQGEKLEKAMLQLVDNGYIASFIGHEPGKALFVGLYSIGRTKELTVKQYWNIPAYQELKKFGMIGFQGKKRSSCLWFELPLQDLYQSWRGRLVVGWPPPERSWWRRAHRNVFPVDSILEESALEKRMPEWDELVLSWQALATLPKQWQATLSQWRGIYLITDISDGKRYVGSACGVENILGRWVNYSKRGDGGNVLLKDRSPTTFRFSILQRVSPDEQPKEVRRIEDSWKKRLHTREPFGLNLN